MEGRNSLGEKAGTKEVVVVISSGEEAFEGNKESRDSKGYAATEDGSFSFLKNPQVESSKKRYEDAGIELKELEKLKSRVQMSTFSSPPSPEIANLGSSPIKPPQVPSESVTRRRSLARSAYSKPKSRLVEPYDPADLKSVEEKTQLLSSGSPYRNSPNWASPNKKVSAASTPRENLRSAPLTPKTPLMASPGGEEEDDEEVYKTAFIEASKKSGKTWRFRVLIEWVAFVCIMGCLIPSLTVHRLQASMIWGLELWKWFVLVLVIFCGRLFSEWFINVLVFLIERNFLLRKKVLYFVFGLKNSVQACIWLGLILLAWALLFNHGVKRSRKTTKILNHVTRALASCLIGAVIWMIKTLLVKLLASSFHVTRFFDRIQESIFHQYVLQTLSGPPLMELEESIESSKSSGRLSFKHQKKGNQGEKEETIDVDKLHKMKQEKISAWTMKGLIKVITGSGLSTLVNTLEESTDDEGIEQKEREITNELEARTAAYQIFRNVAKPGSKYIEEEDVLRFMKKEEVDNVIPLFEAAAEGAQQKGKIKKSTLRKWVIVSSWNMFKTGCSIVFKLRRDLYALFIRSYIDGDYEVQDL
ncbi:hypothetical protein L1049_022060 [Liquidambar formosana]|uniref:Mechanosensitive ion channel protein n=1 Tax=Liquidambar formosana TaxID=63359 RepID=A0AAP0WQH3_LIQFO